MTVWGFVAAATSHARRRRQPARGGSRPGVCAHATSGHRRTKISQPTWTTQRLRPSGAGLRPGSTSSPPTPSDESRPAEIPRASARRLHVDDAMTLAGAWPEAAMCANTRVGSASRRLAAAVARAIVLRRQIPDRHAGGLAACTPLTLSLSRAYARDQPAWRSAGIQEEIGAGLPRSTISAR